jgi:hypothetical protein
MHEGGYYHVQSLAELEGLSKSFQERLLYGSARGNFDLPAWFVPFVNGLNEADRTLVLTTAIERMKEDMRVLFEKVQHGELLPLESDGDGSGVLFEDEEGLQFVYPPNVSGLVACEERNRLLNVFKRLKELQ